MQRSWYATATGVSFLQSIYMYRHMRSRPYQPPGLLHVGDWIWLGPLSWPLEILSACSWWSTSSPSGLSTCLWPRHPQKKRSNSSTRSYTVLASLTASSQTTGLSSLAVHSRTSAMKGALL
jgi:hypothetical protein